ncbi:MAG: tandem-95 repeat protein, partial [Campylobacterota bacterium]|nr:tandem-95 repeat protein [Campylobacterota bacterium]
GTVSLDADGNVVFTPEANYNGEATFTYTVTDGNGAEDTATVTLNVTSVNDAPVITVADTQAVETNVMVTGDREDRIEFGGDGKLELGHDNSDFAVSFTLNLQEDHTGEWRNIFHKGEDNNTAGSADRTPAMWIQPDTNKLHYRISTDENVNSGGDTTQEIPLNEDTVITYMKDADELKLFINGDLADSTTLVGNVIGNDAPLSFGGDAWYDSVGGTIGNIQVHNGVLSEDEIDTIAGGGVVDSDLMAHINFSGSEPFADKSGNDLDATSVSGSTELLQTGTQEVINLDEDTATVIATASDIDGTISLTDSSAEHGTLSMDANGNITYTPDADYNGTDTVSISVEDNDGAVTTQTINLTIDATNDNPVAVDDTFSTITTNIQIDNASFESDSHGDNSWNYGIDGWNQSNNTGAGDWNPNTSRYSDEASDGDNVAWINTGSISQTLDESLTQGSTYILNLDLGDRNDHEAADYTINLYSGDQIVGTINQDDFPLVNGEFTTVTLEVDTSSLPIDFSGFGEALKIEVVKDGGGQLNIDNVNMSKTFTNLETNEDTSLTITADSLLANDTDADGDTLSITAVTATANTHGTVELVDGNIVFTPEANYNGEAKFDYTISDGNGGTDTATVTLNVESVNDVPVITVTDTTTVEDVVTVIATASDIDGT